LLLVLLTPLANLPLVSLIPVVHLDFWISPRIFTKNFKWPSCYFHWLGGRGFMKKPWSKISCDYVPLRHNNHNRNTGHTLRWKLPIFFIVLI
jgi:hypothetical protein